MDPKEMLLRHFEKIVAVLFLGFFGFVTTTIVSRPKELDENEKLSAMISKIEKHMKEYAPKVATPPDQTVELRKECDPAMVADVPAYPTWLVHRRPSFAFGLEKGPERVTPKHEPPTDFRVTEKGRGKVALAWKVSDGNLFARIVGYTIFRKDSEAGEFKELERVGPDKQEYVDTKVAARGKYWYRLVEHAETESDAQQIKDSKTELPEDRRDLPAEDIKEAVETPRDIYVTVDGGRPNDPIPVPPVKGEVQCKVWRWHAPSGKFLYKGYLRVTEGEKIGKEERISIGKTSEKVDFSTGAEVLEVRSEKRDFKGMKREVIVARIKWPWGEEEELVEKELPDEIRDQVAKDKGK